jgi:hypothetical protein
MTRQLLEKRHFPQVLSAQAEDVKGEHDRWVPPGRYLYRDRLPGPRAPTHPLEYRLAFLIEYHQLTVEHNIGQLA